jgi:site-specific recombinase XerD
MRTNQRLAQLWLDALATELGASAGTIATYTDDLNRYLTCLDENSLSLDEVGLEQSGTTSLISMGAAMRARPSPAGSPWRAARTSS